tara:strand:- start:2413 stop:4590 length:2178 start_codon:yes stop_codon:yes gene_type:complete
MAYGTRFNAEFLDDIGRAYKVEIMQDSYAGPNNTFKLDERGFELNYPGQGNDIFDPMKASECTIGYFSETVFMDTLITDIFEASEGTYILKISVDEAGGTSYSDYWKGVIIADNIEEIDDYYPQLYNIRASCGLEFLKSKKANDITSIKNLITQTQVTFPQEINNVSISGTQNNYDFLFSHFDILLECLNLIPHAEETGASDTFMWTSVNSFEALMPTPAQGIDPLAYTANRPYAFGKIEGGTVRDWKTCYDIVKEICTLWGIRIMMTRGFWHILQYQTLTKMKDCSQWYRRYQKDGTLAGSGTFQTIITEGGATDKLQRLSGALYQTDPIINRVIVKSDKVADYLTPAGFITGQDSIPIQTTLPASISASDYMDTFLAAETTNTYGLEFSGTIEWKSNLTVNTTNFPGYSNNNYRIYHYIIVKAGTYYLFYNGATGHREWSTAFNGLYLGFNDITTNSDTSFTQHNFAPSYIQLLPVTNDIEFYNYFRIKKTTNGVSWTTQTGYSTSDFDVHIPTNNALTTFSVNSGGGGTELRFYLTDSNGNIVNQQVFTHQNQRSGADVTSSVNVEIDVAFGNASDYGITDIYTGTNRTTPVTVGTDWHYHSNDNWDRVGVGTTANVENLDLNMLVLLGLDRLQAQPTAPKVFNGTLAKTQTGTDLYQFHKLWKDSANDKCYIPNGLTFTANSAEHTGEWVEVIFDNGTGSALTTQTAVSNQGLTTASNMSF